MIYRKRPESLSDKRPLLDAMGRFRNVLIAESTKVQPFGPTYKAIRTLTIAIDALALFLTGSETYYHSGGSATGSDGRQWRDTGR